MTLPDKPAPPELALTRELRAIRQMQPGREREERVRRLAEKPALLWPILALDYVRREDEAAAPV